MAFADSALVDFVKFARTFVPTIPDLQCYNLYPGLPAVFYPDDATWDKFYTFPSDSLIYGMLNWEGSTTKSQMIYYCLDTKRAPALIAMIRKAGFTIPDELAKFYTEMNKIQQTFNFLDIQFKFEGLNIVTNDYPTFSSNVDFAMDRFKFFL